MLPVCSATTSSSTHGQICFQVGTRTLFPLRRLVEDRCIIDDRVNFGTPNCIHSMEVSFKTSATRVFFADIVERSHDIGSSELVSVSTNQKQFDNLVCGYSDDCFIREPHRWGELNGLYPVIDDLNDNQISNTSGPDELSSINVLSDKFSYELTSEGTSVEPLNSPGKLQSAATLSDMSGQISLDSNVSEPAVSESLLSPEPASDSLLSAEPAASESLLSPDTGKNIDKTTSDVLTATDDALSTLKENFDSFLSQINDSVGTSFANAESTLKKSYDSVTSSLTSAVKSATDSFDDSVGGVLSSIDNTGESAGNKLSGISSDLKESTYKVGGLAINVLRQAIVSVEDLLANTGKFVVYSYGSTKDVLPPEVQDLLNMSEERVNGILRPLGTVVHQVYVALEGLERYLGFDPSDPIVPFVLLLGSSSGLGILYWVLTYGGYSGDLSPELTMGLLSKEDNAVLIDVRPEDLRERDGVPDLRRGARFKYASVTPPEVNSSVRKLLKKGRDLDDSLIAVVIRNLKVVQDRSKVIVIDASGAQAKKIARSLRKLGIKRSYIVQGGFRAWVKNGLRVKELRPDTALTILNEDAEAILEEIRPTPLKLIGYGVGLVAGIYALVEWEKTLQYIGLLGLGQTIYRRIASYEDSEDLKRDVRLLLTPVRLGAEAFSWAAGRVEPNKIGLPTSPSSTAVQSRVQQAAAKHESQPSDGEQSENPPTEASVAGNENLDLSEA